jgi:hypothetical protein
MIRKIVGNFLTQPNQDFPIDCETFAALQDNQSLLAILGNIAGDRTILYGCEINGVNRKAGYVFLRTVDYPAGEILYFEGGAASAGLYLKKEAIPVTANDVSYPQAYVRRSLAAGIGEERWSWNQLKFLVSNATLAEKEDEQDDDIAALAPTPLGVVQIFAGGIDKIPQNYMHCEGQSLKSSDYPELYNVIGRLHTLSSLPTGTFCLPDLRSMFVVGYNPNDSDYNALAKKGGRKKT